MIYICFAAALAFIAAAAVYAIRNKGNFKKMTGVFLICTLLAVACLIFPVYAATKPNTPEKLIFTFLYSIDVLKGSVDAAQHALLHLNGFIYYPYMGLLYTAFFFAPIFTTGFIFSFFDSAVERTRYALCGAKKLLVFSEMSEASLSIALNGASNNTAAVFCESAQKRSELSGSFGEKLAAARGILMGCPITELKPKKRAASITFYLMGEDKGKLLTQLTKLAEKYKDCSPGEAEIMLFASGEEAALIADGLDRGNLRIKIIDDTKYTCYNLLYRYPLFNGIKDNKVSVLLLGFGYMGSEMLKSVVWCGQMIRKVNGRPEQVKLEINVIDKTAEQRRKQFLRNCPELSEEYYDINFINADVTADEFKTALDAKCKDTTYIISALPSDRLNIDTALYVKEYFSRDRLVAAENCPPVYFMLKDSDSASLIKTFSSASLSGRLVPFGEAKESYVLSADIASVIEKYAENTHYSYCDVFKEPDLKKRAELKKAMFPSLIKTEYSLRSSFASALHIKYKLFCAGIEDIPQGEISREITERAAEILRDEDVIEILAQAEHLRWNAFMRSEGYRGADEQTVREYYAYTNSHINKDAKLHPCITDWNNLENVDRFVSELSGKTRDFKEYDRMIVRAIPDILSE